MTSSGAIGCSSSPATAGPSSTVRRRGRVDVGLADKWSFETLGRVLDLDRILGEGSLPADYRSALIGSPVSGWFALATLTMIGLVLAVIVLQRRTA